jgi:hypothetical protein
MYRPNLRPSQILRPGQNLYRSQIRGQIWGQANSEARSGHWGQAKFYSMPFTRVHASTQALSRHREKVWFN